jgi:hypothetical protein
MIYILDIPLCLYKLQNIYLCLFILFTPDDGSCGQNMLCVLKYVYKERTAK